MFLISHVEQPHPGAAAPDHPEAGKRQANQLGLIGHQHQLIGQDCREAGYHRTIAGDIVDIGDTLTAAAGAAVFIGRGHLAIAIGADSEDELLTFRHFGNAVCGKFGFAFAIALPRRKFEVLLALFGRSSDSVEDRERDNLVASALQRHAAHASRCAADKFADIVGGKADRLALTGCQQHIIIAGQQRNPDQPIFRALVKPHREFPV